MATKKVTRQNRQKLDRQIIQCLTRHSDDMVNDLWEFSKEDPKTMERNITQLSRFTRDDILREIQAMPPQTALFLKNRGLNPVDFLGVYFKVLSRNPYTKSGKYSKNTDFVSNQKVIAQCYYDALAVLNVSPAGSTFSTASAATTFSQRTWKSVSPPAPAVSSENLAGGASRAVSHVSRVSHISHISQASKPPASNLSHRSSSNKDVLSSLSLPPEYLSALSARPEEDELQDAGLPSSVSVRSSKSTKSNKSTKSERPQSSFAAKHSQLQRLQQSMQNMRARGGLASVANIDVTPDDSVSCVQQRIHRRSQINANTSVPSFASTSSRRKESPSRPPRPPSFSGGSSYRPPTMSVFSTYTSNTLRAQQQQQQQQQQRFIDVPELTSPATEDLAEQHGNSHHEEYGSTYDQGAGTGSDSESQSTESTGSTESDDTFDGRPPSPKSVIDQSQQSHQNPHDDIYSYTM